MLLHKRIELATHVDTHTQLLAHPVVGKVRVLKNVRKGDLRLGGIPVL